MNPTYLATARLLTEVAPVAFESGIFALKGGTAINLFLRNMPRLSVDLDLVFTDHRVPRTRALATIDEALRTGRYRLVKRGFKVQAISAGETGETRLLVRRDELSVMANRTRARRACTLSANASRRGGDFPSDR